MSGTILQTPFFVDMALPFLLVFALVFAVLQKSEILGKGKKQIDALIALAVGLILVAYGNYAHLISQMSAFLAVGLVVILVFMLLTGIFFEPGKFELKNGVKYTGMGIAALAAVIALLYFTHAWDYIVGLFNNSSEGGSVLVANIVFVVVIIVVVVAVVMGGGKSGDSGGKKE